MKQGSKAMSKTILPMKTLLEAGDVYGSPEAGITKGTFYAAVLCGAIRKVKVPGRKKRSMYCRTEVMKAFGLRDE